MAAPIASGRVATYKPTTQPSSTGLASADPAITTTDPSSTNAAASATQRSCWRSMPRARRKRSTSDAAPTTTARLATAKAS
jgi:hypothetical protein